MNIFEIKIQLDSGWQLERTIDEYKVYEEDKTSYTMSRDGSIGTYVLPYTSLDKILQNGSNGKRFFTKDKNKLKEYGKTLDEHMTKYLNEKIKMLNKYVEKLETPWGDTKPKPSTKKEKDTKSDEDF
jgi:hypothetical protein